jgi:AcrR family transcriptional regulator
VRQKGTPVSEPRSAPRRSRSAGSTRDRLIAVSLALFNERGPDRVTTAQIAEAAGVNEGNLYYYFKTKQALILAIFDRFEAAVEHLRRTALQAPTRRLTWPSCASGSRSSGRTASSTATSWA